MRTLDALVAATDVHVWKLARQDLQRSRAEAARIVQMLVDAVLAQASLISSNGGTSP
ncbi:hypothetical protein [Siculibacillus lacustris]|uniref:hypothetical protein n=1 Tax=Siculibacillus lacustris TaxID=1549641 RepID=UPI0013F15CF7|nr:hypothetical protein [Siculibacillus lacustris]